jgi:Tfp pilus assembly protein PilX
MMPSRKQPRGIALILVVSVVALASVLGFVMLSSAALQTRAGANQGRLTSADYLAESGINIAMYYLQYPEKAPGYPSFTGLGYWAGTGGDISIASDVTGTVNVAVTRDANDSWSYEIVSTAKAGVNADTKLTRQTGARVYVRNEYVVKHAGAFNGQTVIMPYMSFTGDVWSAKTFGLRSGAPTPTVSGTIYTKTLTTGAGWVTPTGPVASAPNTNFPAPSNTESINKYPTYTINDVTYSRASIGSSSLGSATLSPSTSNPAGIFYRDTSSGGDFQINDNVVINGTLVVDGNCQIRGTNVIINAQSNFPALIVTGNLEIYQPLKNLTVNGLCYIGGTLRSNGATPSPATNISKFTVNGALLLGSTGSGSTMNGYNVTTVIKYDAAKAKAPEMTSNYRVPKGVSIVRWGLP